MEGPTDHPKMHLSQDMELNHRDVATPNIEGAAAPGFLPNNADQIYGDDDVMNSIEVDVPRDGVITHTGENLRMDASKAAHSLPSSSVQPSTLQPRNGQHLTGAEDLEPRPDWLPQRVAWVRQDEVLPDDVDFAVVQAPVGTPTAMNPESSISEPMDSEDSTHRKTMPQALMTSQPGSPEATDRSPTPQGQATNEDIARYPQVFMEGHAISRPPGPCKLCRRVLNNITKHHVHPRVHIRGKNQRTAPPGAGPMDLKQTIPLCRPCHSMIHIIIPNTLMSNKYYTLHQLKSHPRVQAWVAWVRRQPPVIATSASTKTKRLKKPRLDLPPRAVRRSRRLLANPVTFPTLPEVQGVRRSARLAALVPNTKDATAGPVSQREKGVVTATSIAIQQQVVGKKTRKQKTADKKDAVMAALKQMWIENKDDFPRPAVLEPFRAGWLHLQLHQRIGYAVKRILVKKLLRTSALFQPWYAWVYPSAADANGAHAPFRERNTSSVAYEHHRAGNEGDVGNTVQSLRNSVAAHANEGNQDDVAGAAVHWSRTGSNVDALSIGTHTGPPALGKLQYDIRENRRRDAANAVVKEFIDLTMANGDDEEFQHDLDAQQAGSQHSLETPAIQPGYFFDLLGGVTNRHA